MNRMCLATSLGVISTYLLFADRRTNDTIVRDGLQQEQPKLAQLVDLNTQFNAQVSSIKTAFLNTGKKQVAPETLKAMRDINNEISTLLTNLTPDNSGELKFPLKTK